MKKLSSRLLLLAFIMSFLFQLKAQNITKSSTSDNISQFHKGLTNIADLHQAKIAINVKNMDGYANYSFREGNSEVKVEVTSQGNISELHQVLKNMAGVKIISLQSNLITCWIEIAQLKTFVENTNTIASVRPFLTNPEAFSREIPKKALTKNADGTTNFPIREADSEEEEKQEKDTGTWWSKERDLYEYNMLVDPETGRIPRDAPILAANAAIKAKPFKPLPYAQLTSAELTVLQRGPTNLGGRTRAIGIDKRNSQIMMAGSVSSGLYRSTNGGTTWTRVAPIGQIHNVTSIAQDRRGGFEDTWYYGTGEASGNSATIGSAYRGNGIWKSTDNGLTWSLLTNTTAVLENFDSPFDYVHRITVDTTNGNIYAASGNSIQRSINGGTNWSTVLGTFSNSAFTDIMVTPTGRLYASFDGRDANEGVWTSTTGASGSWTKIAGTISAVRTPATWHAFNTYGRIVMAFAPSNPDVVFFLYWNGSASSCTGTPAPEAKLFKYVQSTNTFTDLSANLPDEAGCSNGNDPFAVQTGYDLLVTVKPDDENTIFIGGTNLYRSTSGFTNTTATKRIGGYNSPAGYALYPNHHPDQHIALFAVGDNTTIYSGNDGGIQKADATAAAVVWTPLNNNYVTYQYYYADIDPANGSSALLGGAQDNGTTTVQTGSNFSSVFGGDGCGVGIMSYTSPTSFNILASSQSGNLVRLTAPSSGFGISPTGLVSSAFVTYFNLDQDNTNYLYFAGASVLYRTRIARTISGGAVSGSATGWEIVPAGVSGSIQCMSTSRNDTYGGAYSTTNANRKLYIGTTTGKVYRLNDPAFAISAAVEISPAIVSPANTLGVCSSIAVNPYDDNEIMVTFANYGVRSVFQTLNANAATPTWNVIEGPSTGAVALGSARASIITKIGATKTYLVGNSTGLYSTQTLSGATTVWDRVGTNEINYALAANMRLRTSDNRIVLGTHGNGMFELQLAAAVNVSSQPMAVTACSGSDVSFSVGAVGVTAYKWQVSPDSNPANFVDLTIATPYSTTNSGATLNITAISFSLNGKYYRCVLTDAFAGTTNSNSASLTVSNPVDPTSVTTNNTNICVGESVSLTATCNVGMVTWYDVATGGAALGTGSPFSRSPTVNNTTYYATCKAGNCESNRTATSPITITTIANPTGVAPNVTEICSGSSVLLSATCSDAGVVVNWYTQASGGIAIGTGSPLIQSPTVNTTYFASCKGASCESSRVASSLVTVVPNLNSPTLVTQVNLKGILTTSDSLYNRADVFTVGSGTCALAPDGVVFNYKKHTFTLSAASTVVASLLTADGGSITPGGADTFMTLYSAFDPTNPCANIVGINDDVSSSVVLSKITTASLPAGTYTVVLSSYDPGSSASLPWTYSIAVKTTAAVLVVGSPPTIVKVNGVTTPVTVNNGISVTLSATCNDGVVTWYDAMTGGTALGTVSPFMAFPATSKAYYVSCKNSCSETARVATQMITVTQNIFVDITKAAAPTQNGISWASAYGNLQTALTASSAGVAIWVAQGTYKTTPTTTRTIYFNIPSDVKVFGGFLGTETMLSQRNFRTNVTILSGEIGNVNTTADNSYHVVNMDASSANTVLDGFTVTGGYANFDPNKVVSAPAPPSTSTIETGGGIVVQNAGMPTIVNCSIVKNAAVMGGGIYGGDASMPKIIACKVIANQATFGAGIYFQGSSNGNVTNTLLSGNRGMGAVYNNSSNPVISNCTFGGNGGYNGGIFNTNSQPIVKNTIIWGNATPLNDTQSIITNSDIQGGYVGVGNLNIDPKYVSPQPNGIAPTMLGDYHVMTSSLIIDRGDNGVITLTDTDLDGNLRRFSGGTVDMGAYEFQGAGVANTVISAQTGNWESNTTWVGLQVPKLGDKVVIDVNHIVTINTEVMAKDVEYRGTGTIKFNSGTAKLNTGN